MDHYLSLDQMSITFAVCQLPEVNCFASVRVIFCLNFLLIYPYRKQHVWNLHSFMTSYHLAENKCHRAVPSQTILLWSIILVIDFCFVFFVDLLPPLHKCYSLVLCTVSCPAWTPSLDLNLLWSIWIHNNKIQRDYSWINWMCLHLDTDLFLRWLASLWRILRIDVGLVYGQ